MFRRSLPNFTRITSPLSRRFKKSQAKDLRTTDEDDLQALDTLNETFVSPPIISLPKTARQYTLDIDGRDHEVECVPLQNQEDGKATRPVEY